METTSEMRHKAKQGRARKSRCSPSSCSANSDRIVSDTKKMQTEEYSMERFRICARSFVSLSCSVRCRRRRPFAIALAHVACEQTRTVNDSTVTIADG